MTTYRPRLTTNQKRAVLERWSASSLSQAEFCRQENISPSAFHHWRNQLSNQRLNESVDDWIELNHPQLDEFETPVVSPPEWNIELVLPGDVILRLRY